MKAAIFSSYGRPEVLKIEEIDKPIPKKNEVLIKVFASSVTSGDSKLRRADPFVVRLVFGLFKPKKNMVLGNELAGVIEETGKNVTHFKKGDRVFGQAGMKLGANAEYKCMSEDGPLELIPTGLTFEEAAAIPFGGGSSLHFLKKAGSIQSGHKILIYGASGSLGTAAVQLAKYFGAHVTGVCSTANLELVKSLGADQVLDYTCDAFTLKGKKYDIIYDTVGKSPFFDCVKSLNKEGIFLRAVTMDLSSVFKGLWVSMTKGIKVTGGIVSEKRENLTFIKKIIEEGKFRPVIDKIYSLNQIAEAHDYVDKGHKKGNVVLTIQKK
jgi:NADPH:quinone reductase-like Zn-dependent oxidoreductase